MIGKIDFKEINDSFPEIFRRVEAGEFFTITKRGKPTADVTPSRCNGEASTETAISNILRAKKRPLSDAAVTKLKEKGRK